jgi:hypothetical protein
MGLVVSLAIVPLAGCVGVSKSDALQADYEALLKVSETDKRWLECELAWTETSIAELQGTTDMAAVRDFERALEEVGSEALLDAYDQYLQTFSDYMYSDAPEYMWEQEWQRVEDSLIKFQEIYAAELRAHLEGR